MKFRFNNSLAYLILRRLFVMVLVTAILAGAVVILDERNEARERQVEMLEKVGVAMSGPLSESVWMVDTPLLERQLKAMTEIPGVSHVAVTTFIGQDFRADKIGYQGSEGFMVRRIQLRHQNEPLGQLEIWGDSHLLRSEVEHVIKMVFIMIVLLLTVLVGVSLVVGRAIYRPLKVMTRHLDKNAPHESAKGLMDELPGGTWPVLMSLASAIDRREQILRGQASPE